MSEYHRKKEYTFLEKPKTGDEADAAAVVKAYFSAVEQHDAEKVGTLFSDDALVHSYAAGRSVVSKYEFLQSLEKQIVDVEIIWLGNIFVKSLSENVIGVSADFEFKSRTRHFEPQDIFFRLRKAGGSWLIFSMEFRDQPIKPAHWYRKLMIAHIIVQVSWALEEVGVFSFLGKKRKATAKEIARDLHAEERILEPCLDFLWATTEFFEKDADAYQLKKDSIDTAFWWYMAYKPVLNNLKSIMTGEMVYGRDVERDSVYLSKGSERSTADAVDRALGALHSIQQEVLVDLGCGGARSLIKFCSAHKTSRGIGIDISSKAVHEARENVDKAGLGDLINVHEADVQNIERWAEFIPANRPVVFLACAIVHEFLFKGESAVVTFFKKIKERFPHCRFLLIEVDAISFEKAKYETDYNKKYFNAVYGLLHPLTDQGMPQSREVWERLTKEAGWTIKNVARAENYFVIYDCEL